MVIVMDATCPQRIQADPLDRCLAHLKIASRPQEHNADAIQQPALGLPNMEPGHKPRYERRRNRSVRPNTHKTSLQEFTTKGAPAKNVSTREEAKCHLPHQSGPAVATDLLHQETSESSRSSNITASAALTSNTRQPLTTDASGHYQHFESTAEKVLLNENEELRQDLAAVHSSYNRRLDMFDRRMRHLEGRLPPELEPNRSQAARQAGNIGRQPSTRSRFLRREYSQQRESMKPQRSNVTRRETHTSESTINSRPWYKVRRSGSDIQNNTPNKATLQTYAHQRHPGGLRGSPPPLGREYINVLHAHPTRQQQSQRAQLSAPASRVFTAAGAPQA